MANGETKVKYWGELARTFLSIMGVMTLIGAPLWKFMLAPMLVTSVSAAMATELDDKINETVSAKIAPITTGLKAIIQGNINSLRERIDILVYKRDFQRDTWSDMDRDELFKLSNELALQQSALDEIRRAERINN